MPPAPAPTTASASPPPPHAERHDRRRCGATTRPAGIGLAGLVRASRSTSNQSLAAPIENCSPNMRQAEDGCGRACATGDQYQRDDQDRVERRRKRMDERDQPERRARRRWPRGSDVDDLVEVVDEIAGQPLPRIRQQRVRALDQVHAARWRAPSAPRQRCRPTAAGGPPPAAKMRSTVIVVDTGRLAEIADDVAHAAPDRHVAHELGGPAVDAVVRLLIEAAPILGWSR